MDVSAALTEAAQEENELIPDLLLAETQSDEGAIQYIAGCITRKVRNQ